MRMNNTWKMAVIILPGMIVSFFYCFLIYCSGNSTQTGNAVIAGVLYDTTGRAVPGVSVALRPRNTLADTSGPSKFFADIATVFTDGAGGFSFDTSIETGTYVIEAASGTNAVFIDSVIVKNSGSVIILPSDTLKPVGAIEGTILLTEGGDAEKIFVLAFGINRFSQVEKDGSFRFTELAGAAYDLKIISSLPDYDALDIRGVKVTSGKTTNLGTVALPFTGIPSVKGLQGDYDTMQQVVMLSWDKANDKKVKGYTIYRQYADSEVVKINTTTITDTFFADNMLHENGRYQYYIAAVDSKTNEGKRSSSIPLNFTSRFRLVTNSPAFGARIAHSSVVFDSALWVIGGSSSDNQYSNDVWRSTDGSTWEQVTGSAAFSPRKWHTSVVFDGKIWVIGGLNKQPEKLNDVWYSTDGKEWQQATGSAEFPYRCTHACVTFQERMWIIGGVGAGNSLLNDVWSSEDGVIWKVNADSTGFLPRMGHSAVVFKNEIWLIGGANGANYFADVWHSANGSIWIQADSLPPSFNGRYYHAAVSDDSSIWVIGGTGFSDNRDTIFTDVWHSSNGVNWTYLCPPQDFTGKQMHTAVSFLSGIWIVGQVGKEARSDVWYIK